MESKTEPLKFQKENAKHRNKVKIALIAIAAIFGLGGGIGIGYAIGNSRNVNNTNSLIISGGQNISGNIGKKITDTDRLSCKTSAGTKITDISYRAIDLPPGLSCDPTTGVISGTPNTKMFGTYTINATAGNLFGSISRAFRIDDAVDTILVIQGMRELAVPYRKTYQYKCEGGTIDVDGYLPDIFTFNKETNTLTYNSDEVPSLSGSFKLKATASDESGRNNTIVITYYGVNFTDSNNYAYVDINDTVTYHAYTLNDGTLNLTPNEETAQTLKAVFFKSNDNVTAIGDDFLKNCGNALTSVDLSEFTNVTTIGNNFLYECYALDSIDLPTLKENDNNTIGNNFLYRCYALTSIDLTPLGNVKSIGSYFLYDNYALTVLDLSVLAKVTAIGNNFLSWCNSLPSVDLSGLSKLTAISDNFLQGCSLLTSADLSPMTSVTSIGINFCFQCGALASVNLSGLSNLTSIGSNFLYHCYALSTVYVGSIDFSGSGISMGANNMTGVANLTTNTIYGAKASEFKARIGINISNWTVDAD
jgi:hypothetical protein